MAEWSTQEIKQFLSDTNPHVRSFFKKLCKAKKATLSEIKSPPTAVAMSMRAFKLLKKAPLFLAAKEKGQSPVYSVDPKYKRVVASFLSKFKEPPSPKKKTAKRKTAKKKAERKKIMRKKATKKKAGRKKVAKKKVGRKPGRPKKTAKPAAPKRVGRPRVQKKKRGRPVSKASKSALSIPIQTPQDFLFWVGVVEKVNAGKKLVISTDGRMINLETR